MINEIYDSGNYTEKFEQDIVEAEKMFVISSAAELWKLHLAEFRWGKFVKILDYNHAIIDSKLLSRLNRIAII